MRLYIDDNRPTPPGWERAHNAEEAKLHLLHSPVDEMSIDYDLDQPECSTCQFQCGHRQGRCSHGCGCHSAGDETGLHLLEWMHRTNRWPKQPPSVHSHNIDGALRMKKFVLDNFPRR